MRYHLAYLLLGLVALVADPSAFAASPSGTLPVLYINTDGSEPITSKEKYVKATYYLDALGIEGYTSIGTAEAPLKMQIKGRGNYSWTGFEKKPYRLKLDDKQPLMGMKKSKHWALLAHADDSFGFMRNATGFQLSRMIGMAWTPGDAPVEVVLNGDYIGLYFLTETIRVDKDRVNVVEQPDGETNPDLVSGGWLVEIDNYDSDPHVTVNEQGNAMWITYKSPEVLSTVQEQYLSDQMNEINSRLYRPDLYDDSWEELVDIDQLARYYIVQEILDDYESFHGSCYMHKNLNEPQWVFGPVWDFGHAFDYPKSSFIAQDRQFHQYWIGQMCRHPHFMDHVKAVFREFTATDFADIYDWLDDFAARIQKAAVADAERWPMYGNPNIPDKLATVKARLRGNVAWLDSRWGDGSLAEYYVVGDFNSWTATPESRLIRVADGIYQATIKQMSKAFKINDGTWYNPSVNFGSNGSNLQLGEPYAYVNGSGENIQIQYRGNMENMLVSLDVNQATVTVSKAPQPPTSPVTVFFDNTLSAWSEIYVYAWTGSEVLTAQWPGNVVQMQSGPVRDNMYLYEFPFSTVPGGAQIIFNNGTSGSDNQTPDCELLNGGVYNMQGFVDLSAIPAIGADGSSVAKAYDILGRPCCVQFRADGTVDTGSLAPGVYIIGGRKLLVR